MELDLFIFFYLRICIVLNIFNIINVLFFCDCLNKKNTHDLRVFYFMYFSLIYFHTNFSKLNITFCVSQVFFYVLHTLFVILLCMKNMIIIWFWILEFEQKLDRSQQRWMTFYSAFNEIWQSYKNMLQKILWCE